MNLRGWKKMRPKRSCKGNFNARFCSKYYKPGERILLANLLELDPKTRFTMTQALNAIYFVEQPKECSMEELPCILQEDHRTKRRNIRPVDQNMRPYKRQRVNTYQADGRPRGRYNHPNRNDYYNPRRWNNQEYKCTSHHRRN
jgi:hypothetical protein